MLADSRGRSGGPVSMATDAVPVPRGRDRPRRMATMTLLLVAIGLAGFATLAVRESPLWQWGVALLALGALSGLDFVGAGAVYGLGWFGWTLSGLGALLLILAIKPIRMIVPTRPVYGAVRSILPRVSRTEQEALDAGTVGWDAELFSGRPDWSRLMDIRP